MAKPKMFDVPLYMQSNTKAHCAAVAAKMVAEAHGDVLSVERIAREMNIASDGVDVLSIGSWFLERGYKVRIQGCFKELPPSILHMVSLGAKDSIRQWCRREVKSPSEFRKRYSKSFLRFFELGGVYAQRPVLASDLETAVGRNEPPILIVDPKWIWRGHRLRSSDMGHTIVPVKYMGHTIEVHDPAQRFGGAKRYSIHELIHACYRWESCAIFIRPPKK